MHSGLRVFSSIMLLKKSRCPHIPLVTFELFRQCAIVVSREVLIAKGTCQGPVVDGNLWESSETSQCFVPGIMLSYLAAPVGHMPGRI